MFLRLSVLQSTKTARLYLVFLQPGAARPHGTEPDVVQPAGDFLLEAGGTRDFCIWELGWMGRTMIAAVNVPLCKSCRIPDGQGFC
jgi:hypothetical protein